MFRSHRSDLPARTGARRHGLLVVVAVLGASLIAFAGCAGTASTPPPAPPATPTATLAPTATPLPQPTVVFQDPLTSNANGWAATKDCFFKSDGYHIRGGSDYVPFCFAPVQPPANSNISVQAKQINGPLNHGYGLLLRASVTNNMINGYFFLIVGDGAWTFIKITAGAPQTIAPFTATGAIHQGLSASNTIEVRMTGAHFAFYVNGTQVGSADDPTYADGIAGLMAGTSEETVYTNFQVAIPADSAYIAPRPRSGVAVVVSSRLLTLAEY